ncbi:hypothetical protein QR680_013964 [Steinernema hermaphroditum]|uniref:Uncharacterized protein n=1 Tax=Steinernema hermaphroditum TaxID=289476 RepID=A0AA39M3E6_9BILA|nr:hypothetical protein QR680_013964 [Steinernema hermaphroditum]
MHLKLQVRSLIISITLISTTTSGNFSPLACPDGSIGKECVNRSCGDGLVPTETSFSYICCNSQKITISTLPSIMVDVPIVTNRSLPSRRFAVKYCMPCAPGYALCGTTPFGCICCLLPSTQQNQSHTGVGFKSTLALTVGMLYSIVTFT